MAPHAQAVVASCCGNGTRGFPNRDAMTSPYDRGLFPPRFVRMSRPWHHVERGRGRPLVLLHGIGMSHAAWTPVMGRLARERRVIAVDLAGFGRSAPLPDDVV